MSQFDDGMRMSQEAELGEMGDDVFLDGVKVQGVVSDVVVDKVQSAGGRRDVTTFSVYVSQEDGEHVAKGAKVEADGRRGRVVKRVDLGGGGWELLCGPVNSWGGKVPGV